MKYENYYYIDGHVEIEGNLGTVRLLKPYRMLPYWNERELSIVYIHDNGLVDEGCPCFNIAVSIEQLKKLFKKSKNQVVIKQTGEYLGEVQLVHGYSAVSTGESYYRSIDMYKMRVKRKNTEETWFFIEGTTRLVEEKDTRDKGHQLKKKQIQEFGHLKFFIWFYVRDTRIKDIFKDKDCRKIYEDWVTSLNPE